VVATTQWQLDSLLKSFYNAAEFIGISMGRVSRSPCKDVYHCLKEAYSANLDVNDKLAEILIAIEHGYASPEELVMQLKELVPDLYKLVMCVLHIARILNDVSSIGV
jgi:uncharacterized membrane protein YjjP (DUF1212 family)